MNFIRIQKLLKAISAGRVEEAGNGLLYIDAGKDSVVGGGVFQHNLNGGPWVTDENILPLEGRNYILEAALRAQTQLATFYIAPFAANVTPVDGLTAATFASTQTEFTNYDEATRQPWVIVSSTAGSLTNAAAPAFITIADGVQTSVYGAGLLSAQAKSATSGKLIASSKFASARTGLSDGDTLGFRYTINLNSA